jgi:hypothetical protein
LTYLKLVLAFGAGKILSFFVGQTWRDGIIRYSRVFDSHENISEHLLNTQELPVSRAICAAISIS